jgi:hypothetical protein
VISPGFGGIWAGNVVTGTYPGADMICPGNVVGCPG